AYVFATMVIDRARYAREQVEKDMLAIRGAAAKDIPGLIPVSKDDPLYNLYIAARAVAERDEKRAWDLTRPRLNLVRQEWPTLDIGFVAWTVDQMRKDSMLKEAREFCFEILLKEYDLPAEDVASVMLTKGDAYRDMNNVQAAAIEYKSLKDNKRYRTTQRGSLAKYRLIDLLIETGEFGAAEGQLMAMTEAGSRDEQAEAYYLLGKISFEQEDYVQSRDNLLETFKRVDGHAEGRLLEGELKLKLPRGLASTDVLLGRLDLQTVVVPGRELTLKLRDTNLSIAQGGQSIPVIVSTSLGGDRESVRLTVSPDDKTLFQGSIATALGTPKHGNMSLEIYGGEKVSYIIDPAYQKANEINYSAKILDVKSNARLVASSGEFLTPEEEEQRRMEQEMRRREGDRESVRFSQQRGTVVRPGSAIYVQVTDYDRDVGEQKDTVTVDARTSSGDLVTRFTLTETEVHSGVFEGELATGIPFPQVTASDTEEGADPNAIINSTKKGSWVSLPDGVNPKWVDVDTMSSHAVKSITIKTPDASRIKSMRVVGVLDANPITLGNYRIDGQALPVGGVAQLINRKHVGQELVDAREALGKGGKISELSSMVYRRADTDHKGRDGWVNTSLSGTFWVDEESRMTFTFMQPASPNGWQSVWLSIDGRPVLGARGISQGALQATKAVTLSAGAHTMEVIMVDHWKDSSVIVGLGQDDGTFVPMPASLFSVTENKELADALRPRGKVTQTGDGFSVALTKPERIRSIRCLFDDFSGDGLSISQISMAASDGKAILPTTHDFSTGLENDLLEIAAGDAIEVSYVDEQRLHTKSPKLAAKLSASFYNATVDLLYEIILTRRDGSEELVHAEAERVNPGAQVVVRVTDYDMDLTDERDTIPVTLTTAGGETLKLMLLEGHHVNPEAKNQTHTGVFSEFLKLGDVTGKNTLKVLPKDEITVTYLDKENTLPGIPINRDLSVVTAPDDSPILSVYPTHVETVEDTSREGKAKRVKLERMGKKELKLMRDQIVAGAPVTLETPVRVSVQAPIIFSVAHKKLALHARSISHIYAVAASELAAAERDGREPVVTRIPLRLSRSTDVAIGKGFRLANRAPAYQPLEEGVFGGVIRLQIGSPGDEADTLVRDMREFSSGDLMRNSGNKDDLLSRGRVATLVVAGSDTVHLSVKDEQGHVLAKGDVELLSDAKLELMDRSYSLNHSAVHLGQRFFVRVTDPDHDLSEKQDVVNVAVKGPHGTATLKLTETMPHSGVFSAPLEPRLAAGVAVTSVTAVAGIDVALGDELTFRYTDAKPLQSTSPVAHEIKGRVHHGGDGNMAGFTKRFQDPDMAVKTRFLMAEALFEMAKHHRKLKQTEQATAEIGKGKRILEEAMRDYPDTKYVAQGEYLLANLAQEMKKYTEAVGRYSNIIGSWPDSEYAIKAQLKKAICYEKLKLPSQAAEEYVRLTYMYPDSSYVADATVRLANQYYKTKNYKTAGRIFKKFYDRHPDHALGAKSLFLAGQCSMKMEDYTEAVFRFKDLIRAYPDETKLRPEAMYWLGDAAFLGRDSVTAYKAFKQVTWDYPETRWAKIARGRLTDQRFQTMDE
ncbi:MAG: tetratricopeptide repeat protein, partial [Verrucomicrobia bacterium]|nr:tetratricopeptide repeat protein [Verrucomicrobiota bacterium]